MEQDIEKIKSVIESILFAAGRAVEMKELQLATEIEAKDSAFRSFYYFQAVAVLVAQHRHAACE